MNFISRFFSSRGLVPKLVTSLSKDYSGQKLFKDVFAGLTVGVIALPLAMAFAIGAGASPAQGLYTAIIAGLLIAMLGGSSHQVSGPTGAFVVIIADIIARHGMSGLILATFIAGLILVVMGVTGLGNLIKFIPYPVITGFTTGIGVIIATGQIKDFLGLNIAHFSAEFFERFSQVATNITTTTPAALGAGAATIIIILLMRKFTPRIPGAITAVVLVSAAALIFKLPVETIGSRYGEIPQGIPAPSFPPISWELVRQVFPSAITIAMLGAIESLLSAVVADGMTGDRHKANMELTAQGMGNMASALFGGIPATGAIARTAANIKNGAQSPVSAIVHALTLLAFVLFMAKLASVIPLAVLAGILLVVAWDMSDLRRFFAMKLAPKSDLLVMLITFLLTVIIDLTVAVQAGVLMAVFLFIRRMTQVTGVERAAIVPEAEWDVADLAAHKVKLPKGTEVYDINGPFFFGVADQLQSALDQLEKPPRFLILRMHHVPALDASAMNALHDFIRHNQSRGTKLLVSGAKDQPRKAMEKYGLDLLVGRDHFYPDTDSVVAAVWSLAGQEPQGV